VDEESDDLFIKATGPLEARGYEWRYGPETHPVYVARNQVVHRFLTEDTAKQHLVMIDAALVPIAGQTGTGPDLGTARVLTEPGEVVYCGYYGRYGTAGHHLDFGCGCFRASRRVYEAMPPPWFDFGYDRTLTQKTECECARFAQRLSSLSLPPASGLAEPGGVDGPAGSHPVVPRQVGIIGRLTELIVVPSGRGRMRIVSPHTVALGEV